MADAINASVDHLQQWLPWASKTNREETEELARHHRANYLTDTTFMIGIMNEADECQLGGCSFELTGRPLFAKEADVGMWIRADRAGQGLGSRVLIALLEWGFSAWQWVRLTWTCAADNVISRRTAERAGMLQEATFRNRWQPGFNTRRDDVQYAALRDEWRPPQ